MIHEPADPVRVELTTAPGAEQATGGSRYVTNSQDRRRGSPGSSRRSGRQSRTKGRAVMARAIGRYRSERFTRGADALRAYLDRIASMTRRHQVPLPAGRSCTRRRSLLRPLGLALRLLGVPTIFPAWRRC